MANDTKTIPMFYCLEMGLQLSSWPGWPGLLCSGRGGPGHRAVEEEDGEKRKSEDLNRFQLQLLHSTTDTWSPGTRHHADQGAAAMSFQSSSVL